MLLERQTQLEQLDGLLMEAARGRGRVAALGGEAGAGKTSLVEAFIERAAEGTRILRSACEDLSIPDPLGPLYDLAREAHWALPQAIDHRQGQRLPLFSDALEIFETKAQPSLLVIEDLHWADDATLDFVRFLGRRIANTHILLLVTARNDRSEAQVRVRRALKKSTSINRRPASIRATSRANRPTGRRACGWPARTMASHTVSASSLAIQIS